MSSQNSQKLPDTCPSPASQSQTVSSSQADRPWGYLFPNRPNVSFLALFDDEYLIGRSPRCNLVLTDAIQESFYCQLSKEHFRVKRAPISPHSGLMEVNLIDLSFNGTYINGKKIGKGKKTVLRNNDLISLAVSTFQAFTYMDREPDLEVRKYPRDVHDSYALSRKIGSGAYAEVHHVFEKKTGKSYAMKIIQKIKFLQGDKFAHSLPKRLMREVKILRSLSHSFVIKFHDAIDHPNTLFLVVELVQGGDLFSFLRDKKKLKEFQAKSLFYQLTLAVRYLHSRGIIHRDIKLENILVSHVGVELCVKLADFGLSKFMDSHSLLKTHCGTPMYIAPEILKSEGRPGSYNEQIDVWSMGVVLYMCLSGTTPFLQGDSKISLNKQILTGYYSFPRRFWVHVSQSAHNVIKRMLVVDPQRRIKTRDILDHPWLMDADMKSRVNGLIRAMEKESNSQGKENIDDDDDDDDDDDGDDEKADGPVVKRPRLTINEAKTACQLKVIVPSIVV